MISSGDKFNVYTYSLMDHKLILLFSQPSWNCFTSLAFANMMLVEMVEMAEMLESVESAEIMELMEMVEMVEMMEIVEVVE